MQSVRQQLNAPPTIFSVQTVDEEPKLLPISDLYLDYRPIGWDLPDKE